MAGRRTSGSRRSPPTGLTLEWVQRKFVSVLTRQDNGTLRYVSQLRETVRDSRPVTIAAGGSPLPLPTQEPGDFALVAAQRRRHRAEPA